LCKSLIDVVKIFFALQIVTRKEVTRSNSSRSNCQRSYYKKPYVCPLRWLFLIGSQMDMSFWGRLIKYLMV